MHIKGLLILGAALAVTVVMASASGAGTATAGSATRIDVSSRAAVVDYLRSIHVNPASLVIQRGARNYAGPNCPGKGWACTSTAHPVVQVARAGGKNTFQCASAQCAVVQAAEGPLAAQNTAKCVKTNGATQSCSIVQTSSSGENVAIVYMNVLKTTGLTQDTSQVALITQQATGGPSVPNNNRACITQVTKIDTSTVAMKGMPVVTNHDAHQTLTVNQDSLYGDNNASEAATSASGGSCDATHRLGQSQTIKQLATGSARIEQNENTHDQGANLTLDIEQNQNGGGLGPNNTNNAVFSQDNSLTAVAKTPVGPVVQTQGTQNGGILAKINQFAHGLSNADALQTELQCEHAQTTGPLTCDTPHPPSYSLTQTQWGPVRKGGCCSTQGDNVNDTFTVNQSTTQNNDTENSQRNVVQAECTTSGGCTANQDAAINGEESHNTQAGQNVNAETQCAGSACTAFTVNGPQLSASNTNIKEFGFGGMRGNGTGTIAVSGVTGPVARALLYWNGPTNSSDPTANANVIFNGTPVTGTNIGFASDNCWGFQNSQSYQADVTGLVTGDGSYSLSNFDIPPDVEVNGVSLVVFYNDTDTSNDRNVTLWSGNDSNVTPGPGYAADGWDETLNGVQYQGGTASLDFIVSDGQFDGTSTYQDDALVVNGLTLVPAGDIFNGDSTPAGSFNSNGALWDVKSFDLTPFLTIGSNNIHLTTGAVGDCLSLVAFAANVPASAPPGPMQAQQPPQPAPPVQAARPAPVRGAPGAGALHR